MSEENKEPTIPVKYAERIARLETKCEYLATKTEVSKEISKSSNRIVKVLFLIVAGFFFSLLFTGVMLIGMIARLS